MITKESNTVSKSAVLAAALLVAVGGLIYELILGTASAYLFGDSITSFSLSIGTMLFGMGIGSLLSAKLLKDAGRNFVLSEIILSLVGGNAVILLFGAYLNTRLYWLVFVFLSVTIGLLIGFEIPLMVRIAKTAKHKDVERLLSRVLALDYIGALVASILFPFLLLPYLGLVRTSFAMGLLNSLIAFFILSRLNGIRIKQWIVVLNMAVILFFAVGFTVANRVERFINTAQYSDPVVAYKLTPYQKIALTAYGKDVRLYLNDQLQFSSIDEARYHETLTHSALSSVETPKKVLILGGGDGLIAREALRHSSVNEILLVDIDQAMTDMARTNRLLNEVNHHSLSDPRVKILNQDAFSFVRDTNETFDAIIIDLVDPANERVAKLYSQEFYRDAHKRLYEGGVLITQASSTYFTPNAFQTIRQTIQSTTTSYKVVPLSINVPSFGEWGFLISVPKTTKLFASNELPSGLMYVSKDSLEKATVLPSDFRASVEADTISTLLRPQLYHIYQQDMRQWRY